MAGQIVGMRCGLRSRAEYHMFTSVDLVDRRHSFESGSYLRLPEPLACRGVQGADLTVARAREDQPAGSHHRSDLRKMRTGIFEPARGQFRDFAQRHLPLDGSSPGITKRASLLRCILDSPVSVL